MIGYSLNSRGWRVLMNPSTGEIVESTDVSFHESTAVPGGIMHTVETTSHDNENPVER